MEQPVQIFSWFPVTRCLTPTMHRLLWLPVAVLLLLFALCGYWALTRVQPLTVLAQDVVPSAHPGELVRIEARVKRDLRSGCTIEAQRYIITPAGYRVIEEGFSVGSVELYEMTASAPGLLRTTITVPPIYAFGRAKLLTHLRYYCTPLDEMWPNEATTMLFFDVVEARK